MRKVNALYHDYLFTLLFLTAKTKRHCKRLEKKMKTNCEKVSGREKRISLRFIQNFNAAGYSSLLSFSFFPIVKLNMLHTYILFRKFMCAMCVCMHVKQWWKELRKCEFEPRFMCVRIWRHKNTLFLHHFYSFRTLCFFFSSGFFSFIWINWLAHNVCNNISCNSWRKKQTKIRRMYLRRKL